ncbi:MAG: ABC transporter substrate binding protein [Candidatus Krumholzibacteriia bacterium]
MRCRRNILRPGRAALLLAALALGSGLLGGAAEAEPVRILVVDSYHLEYPWSAGIRHGINEVLGVDPGPPGRALSRDGRYDVWTEFMDTKRQPDPAKVQQAARRVAGVVESWKPAVVIACDDNAVRDLVVPYLLGRETPVVYCGVNWDASVYGLPDRNVTGMIEVDQTGELVATLRPLARGDRLGLLVIDSTSGRRDVDALRTYVGLDLLVRLVPDYPSWKAAFAELQDQVDMLLIKQNVAGVAGWDLADAVRFTFEATRIPTGCTTEPTMPCVLVAYIKNPDEQGIWAARTALEILAGASPESITPGVKHDSRVFLNISLARKQGVRFPMALIERATFMEERWSP